MQYDGANITQIKSALHEQGLSPNKRLGQNFLCDMNIADAIVRSAGDLDDTCVLEIGPGAGALTVRLLPKAARVVAIELDAGLCRLLRSRIQDPHFSLICADALKVPLKELGLRAPATLVANLPYYVTTPLIMRYISECKQIDRFVLMMQKEVAQRLCAPPGNRTYGAVSVAVQYHTDVQTVFDVAPSCFYPKPKVSSTVVVLNRRTPLQKPKDEELMFRVVRASFAMRRKTLLNNLSAMDGFGRDRAKQAIETCGFDGMVRGETLSLDAFISLADAIADIQQEQNGG